MATIDLLKELKLNDYYPQKLSFSEAIKLRGKFENGCQVQYGLEIVRKLLMFDSTAVVSVASEIDKRLNSISVKDRETKDQRVSDGVRPPLKSNVRPSWRKHNAEPTEGKLHPMDLLVVVMNCCDDFLRQILVEKLFANKLSIPILLPEVRNSSYKLLHLALRSLVPEVQDLKRESSSSLTDTLVDLRNPVVSFIRVGNLHRSKSKLVNELLSFHSFNTFFHRECPNGSAKRSVSNGSIEAAWFQSSTATEEEFNCKFFTALNLRGNATDYPKQTQFLCQSSTLVVFMVDSFKQFKKLYENVLKNADVSQAKIIVCYISPESPDKVDDKYFKFLQVLTDHGVISAVKYDWLHGTKKMSDVDLKNDLRKTISDYLTSEHRHSNPVSTYANISQSGKNFGFLFDEDKFEWELGRASADEFFELVSKLPQDCKPLMLPLQREPWEKFGKLEREQRGKSHDSNQDEYFIAEKETEKRRQREIQCRSLIQQHKVPLKFSSQFYSLQEQNLLYYLNSCKIKLDARSRVITSNLLEKYKKEKQENHPQLTNEREPEVKRSKFEQKTANSVIGLEHFLREHGQMYEAVISEEIRMKEELKKNTSLTPDVIRNFPSIVARLLLKGQPLELMDGDASNVPITWLKAVLNQIRNMTNNAKIFVLSIIGVQSSGKSTLLNALFGLQFPVSAGRCTRGIYCHLVPVDKGSLHSEYDYVLAVDTEGLGASEFTGNSTFRDNELATFAIGLADATIINMKGENWSEMKDILQIVAYGLIRIRKTKAELELMPKCMFVHQNVSAADAADKNQLGQDYQLKHLDKAIKAAGHKEGFTDITKFDDVVKYDPKLHSWYFPDLWNGTPPKARINQDYIGKANELRQHLMQVMKDNPSKLTISSFFLRMSDLWNAMLHNDFVLCFRNTQEIISQEVLNDRISHQVDSLRNLNKLEQKKIRYALDSVTSIEEFNTEKVKKLSDLSHTLEKNFTDMKATLEDSIDATDICASLKQQFEASLSDIKEGERLRMNNEMAKDISFRTRKLEYESDQRVKELKVRLADLEKCSEEVESDKLHESAMKEVEHSWQQLIADNKILVDERMKIKDSDIKGTIRGLIQKLRPKYTEPLNSVDLAELFKKPLVVEMPQVTEHDIVQKEKDNPLPSWVVNFVHSKSHVYKAHSSLQDARKKWELQFQNQRDLEFNAFHLEGILFEVGQLLGILRKEDFEVPPGTDEACSNRESNASQLGQIMSGVGQMLEFSRKEHEDRPEFDEMCLVLPPGYSFTRDYIIRFIKFACHYTYNRSLENSKKFISLTDPLADIEERCQRSISNYQQLSPETIVDAVSEQIFDYAVRSFVRDLGELIKTEVCKEDNKHLTFKNKRAFLKTILTGLGLKVHNLTQGNEEKQRIFKEFMFYVELGESEASEDFFLDVILELLKEMLTKGNVAETVFEKMVENYVGKVVEKAKTALRQADTECNGSAREYVGIFKKYMNVTTEIYFRINILDGFTEEVLEKIDNLYANFLRRANSLFETLVCENNRAAIRPLFEKIMGCRQKCPFCSARCSQSLEKHVGAHRANHYPTGMKGTVNIWGLFANTQETHDATEERRRKRGKLSLDTCQTLVGTRVDIRTKATLQKYNKWYHRFFNLNYHSFKNFKELAEYATWDIPYSQDHNASLYWKWFMAQFGEQLAQHNEALCPKIPEAWQQITWQEADKSLDEPYLTL